MRLDLGEKIVRVFTIHHSLMFLVRVKTSPMKRKWLNGLKIICVTFLVIKKYLTTCQRALRPLTSRIMSTNQ